MDILKLSSESDYLQRHADLKSFIKDINDDDLEAFLNWANEPVWTVRNLKDITPKMLNHWEKFELIPFKGSFEKHKERKFSHTEFLWIVTVIKLRDFGISLNKILCLKEDLVQLQEELLSDPNLYGTKKKRFEDWLENSNPLLDFILYTIYFKFESIFLISNVQGNGSIFTDHEFMYFMNHKIFSSHHFLEFKEIVKEMFPNRDLSARPRSEIQEIDMQILEIVLILYQSKASEISIKRKDGRVERVEVTTIEDANTMIDYLMKKDDYQEITIQQVAGETKSIKRTKKIKF